MIEPRYAANLPVTVAGADAKGNPFRQTARIINISRRGGRLSGVPSLAGPGEIVTVTYAGTQADFLIVWIKREAGVAGILCLENGDEIWGNKLPEAAAAAQLAGARRADQQARPQPPAASIFAPPGVAGVRPQPIVRLTGPTPAKPPVAAGTTAGSDTMSSPEAPTAPESGFAGRVAGAPRLRLRLHPSSQPSFYGGIAPVSRIEVEPAEPTRMQSSCLGSGARMHPGVSNSATDFTDSNGSGHRIGGSVDGSNPRPGRQRRYPRYSCSGGVTAYVRGSSSKLWGQLNVISLGGCYVDTTAPFHPQTELDLLIGAHGIQVRVQGRVTSNDRQAGMGVMFTKMSPTDSAQLRRLVELAATPWGT